MIGVYDSGEGGKTVLSELQKLIPWEDYIYFADSAYCPYGPRDPEFIRTRACAVTDFLISKGCELAVVACNTATAAAISYLREHYTIPFVGMEPAIKPAALHSRSGVVGVLATAGTFKGRLYLNTLAAIPEGVRVIEQVGGGLVEAVEAGDYGSPTLLDLLHRYIDPMIEAGADHIVLGCTHYPHLTEAIRKVAGEGVTIVNPAPAVARHTLEVLRSIKKVEPSTRKGSTEYFSSKD